MFCERLKQVDRAFFCFESFGVGFVAKFLFKIDPGFWGSFTGGVVSRDEFASGPAKDIADAIVDVDAVYFFRVFGGPAKEGKGAAANGRHGAGFGKAMFFGKVVVGGIDIRIPFGMAGNITVNEGDVIAFFDEFEVSFVDEVNGFPEEAAPEPGFAWGCFFGCDDFDASLVVVDAELVGIKAFKFSFFTGGELCGFDVRELLAFLFGREFGDFLLSDGERALHDAPVAGEGADIGVIARLTGSGEDKFFFAVWS